MNRFLEQLDVMKHPVELFYGDFKPVYIAVYRQEIQRSFSAQMEQS